MKAKPLKREAGEWVVCDAEEATHVTLNIPGPTGELTLPVIQRGTRKGTGCWTWNGSVDKPSLKPSVLTNGHFPRFSDKKFRCHSHIEDGQAKFLEDCSHEFAGKTVDLLEVENG